MSHPKGRLLLLCVLLLVWEPLNLALSASSDLPDMLNDTAIRTAFLLFRLVVAAVGVAAGVALWEERLHGFLMAKAALVLSAVSAVVRFTWFPGNTPPGLRLPYGLVFVGYNAAWLLYLVMLERRQEGI